MNFPLFIIDNPRVLCVLLIIAFSFLYYHYRILHIDSDRIKNAIKALYQRMGNNVATVAQPKQQQQQVPPPGQSQRSAPFHTEGFAPAASFQHGAMTPEICGQYATSVTADACADMFSEGPMSERKMAASAKAIAAAPQPEQLAEPQRRQQVAPPQHAQPVITNAPPSSLHAFDDDLNGVMPNYDQYAK